MAATADTSPAQRRADAFGICTWHLVAFARTDCNSMNSLQLQSFCDIMSSFLRDEARLLRYLAATALHPSIKGTHMKDEQRPRRPLPTELDTDWIGMGFDPDRERFEYIAAFTLTQAWRSISETRRSVSVAVTMQDHRDRDAPVISFVLDHARAIHRFLEVDFNHFEQGSLEMPEWYFEGSVVAPRAVRDQRIRIHVSALYDDFGESDIFSWQLFDVA